MVYPVFRGRLGNVLFQAASAISYAREHDLEYTVPTKTEDPKWNPIYLQHLANPAFDDTLLSVMVEERGFPFQVRPFKEEWRKGNIFLKGWWQTEKYFKDCKEDIFAAFRFPYRPMPGVVAVHVRRGDYLKWVRKHPPVSKEWIESAMARIFTHQYRFFSDDIAWCKKTFGHRIDCTFSEGQSELEDLISMSWCENQVCSASTFSWWAAMLNRNPDKRVIMPKLWFVKNWGKVDPSDIVPPEWERY